MYLQRDKSLRKKGLLAKITMLLIRQSIQKLSIFKWENAKNRYTINPINVVNIYQTKEYFYAKL